MRFSALFLAGLGSLPLMHATNIYYQPAAGYFQCPDEGMVCNIIDCDGCSILSNGFDVTTVGDTTVYTSTGPNSDISITAGGSDSSAIDCDLSCGCQEIIPGVGCNVPVVSDRANDPFAGGIAAADGSVSEANLEEEESGARMAVVGGSLVLASVAVFFL